MAVDTAACTVAIGNAAAGWPRLSIVVGFNMIVAAGNAAAGIAGYRRFDHRKKCDIGKKDIMMRGVPGDGHGREV